MPFTCHLHGIDIHGWSSKVSQRKTVTQYYMQFTHTSHRFHKQFTSPIHPNQKMYYAVISSIWNCIIVNISSLAKVNCRLASNSTSRCTVVCCCMHNARDNASFGYTSKNIANEILKSYLPLSIELSTTHESISPSCTLQSMNLERSSIVWTNHKHCAMIYLVWVACECHQNNPGRVALSGKLFHSVENISHQWFLDPLKMRSTWLIG